MAMTCEWLILCSAVEKAAHPVGHSLMGVIGRIAADYVPTTTTPIVVAFRLSGPPAERFDLSVDVRDPSGDLLLGSATLSGALTRTGVWDGWLPLGPLTLYAFGTYRYALRVNEQEIGAGRLLVEQFVH